MSGNETKVPCTELRLCAYDLDHNGKPETVIIEFYRDGKIDYAVEAIDRKEHGFSKIESRGLRVLDNQSLKALADLALALH